MKVWLWASQTIYRQNSQSKNYQEDEFCKLIEVYLEFGIGKILKYEILYFLKEFSKFSTAISEKILRECLEFFDENEQNPAA